LAALAIVGLMILLLASNVWTALRNQQLLAEQEGPLGIEDWFQLSSRDIAKVALEHPRHTIFGRAGIYYFLEQEIAGSHLTIPSWMHWLEWPFENVSHLDVTVAEDKLYITKDAALRIRKTGRRRQLARYSSERRTTARLYLLVGLENRYVVAEVKRRTDVYVIPESVYRASRLEAE
jgi:hypothetical protein